MREGSSPLGIAGDIDDDPPDPGFQCSAALEAATLADRLRESLLDGVLPKITITCNRCRRPAELGSARAIELLEFRDHYVSDARHQAILYGAAPEPCIASAPVAR
jgi:hypothetical protein